MAGRLPEPEMVSLFILIFISENTYLFQHRELQKVLLLPASTAQCSWPSWVQRDFLVQVGLVWLLFFPVGLWFAWLGGQPVLTE